MTRQRVWAQLCPRAFTSGLAVGLAVAMALGVGGCTLISVATMVGKKFVPALAKGSRKQLKHHSSWRLTWYWDGFTDREIETAVKGNPAMSGGKGTKKGARKKRQKSPGVSLVKFRSKGNQALLVARRGKMRFRFNCVRENGRWKVDEVTFPIKGKQTQLTRMLKLLLAAKAIQAGMETGSRYLLVNISTPRLRRLVWDRLSDAELEALTSSATSSTKGAKKRRNKRRGPTIRTKFFKDRAVVSLSGSALPAKIVLLEKNGQYWVDEVRLKLGGEWHNLAALAGYLQPSLGLLRWVHNELVVPRSDDGLSTATLAGLIARMRGALSSSLWKRTFAWLTPADLQLLPWKSIRKALQARARKPSKKPPSVTPGPSLGPKSITRFHRVGNRLEVTVTLPGLTADLTMVRQRGSWRVHSATMTRKGQTLQLADLLESLAPMVRLAARAGALAPVILSGNKQSNGALADLMRAIRHASSKDLNRRLWSRIPMAMLRHVPLHVLPAALRGLIPATTTGNAPRTGGTSGVPRSATLPNVTLVKTVQTKRRLALTLQVRTERVTVVLVREQSGWKLDNVFAKVAGKRRSMKLVLGMMAPAAAMAHAVLSGKGAPLREAVTPRIRRTVIEPLLRILGPRFGSLMHSLRTQTLRLPAKAAGRRAGNQTPKTPAKPAAKPTAPSKVEFKSLTFDKAKRRAVIALQLGPMAPLKIVLTQDAAQVWRIADLEFPLGGKTLSLIRTGPIVVPLFGFGISLLTRYLPGIRRACTRSFNRAVWQRLTPAKFRKLLKQFMPRSQGTARRSPARGGSAKKGASSSKLPRLLALRIKDTGRWHWAEVELKIGSRRIRLSLVGAKGKWKVHDLHITLKGQLLSLKSVAALLL
jgi:hypothetical protein